METLGELERKIMNLLWKNKNFLTANEIQEKLKETNLNEGKNKELAITTILTVLSRLEKKSFVHRKRKTRPHLYTASKSQAEHTADVMNEVLDTAPNREAVLARFLGSVNINEINTLKKLLKIYKK